MPIVTVYPSTKIQPHPVKVWTDDIDSETAEQLKRTASLPFIYHHVAGMPDVHLGKGATIGSVIATVDAIVPAATGVDIGCGVSSVRLSLTGADLPFDLKPLRSAIEQVIPLGPGREHRVAKIKGNSVLAKRLENILHENPALRKMLEPGRWARQAGTLGGGNHFFELCLDEDDNLWVMLHSGSRGIGNTIGRYFIAQAKQEMERANIHLPDANLAYFKKGSKNYDKYIEGVSWAQDYARINRELMMKAALKVLAFHFPRFSVTHEAINCHHNYIEREVHFGHEVWVTRKGAIRARKGDLGVIPGSMGANSYVVRGLGNPESFFSCSHGAGRRLSRTQAKKQYSEQDLIEQTAGVECRKDKGVIDEIPSAYKDIDTVMRNQSDLVEIVHTLRQVVNIKG
ncbi:RtcB family protein [Photobacterium sp. SDRW27]|uniref:RtcB family protein n=1 Tax=Photobacterium obscurum TaxID=2829490 RepID=UPI002243EE85|nr:RtcB family protein [Photobacterium obscurum]MCW8329066.1 RtcB family protein [Photobacterium obscurum]